MDKVRINRIRREAADEAMNIAKLLDNLNDKLECHYDDCFYVGGKDGIDTGEIEEDSSKYWRLAGSLKRTIDEAIQENQGVD